MLPGPFSSLLIIAARRGVPTSQPHSDFPLKPTYYPRSEHGMSNSQPEFVKLDQERVQNTL